MVDVLDRPEVASAAVQPSAPAPAPRDDAAGAAPRRPVADKVDRRKPQGLPVIAYVAVALAVAVLLWGAWVTKHLLAPPATVPMASVRLEGIVSEYVQAQSHSNGQPQQVAAQTQAFMSALDDEMKKVGASGTTVLVGEAVLSKNVPDITDQIRRAVFARVPLPAAAPNTPAGPAVGATLPQVSGNVAPAAPGAAVPTASPFGPAPVSPVEATVTQSAPGGVDGSGN
ncbi:TrbI F-type domain-containing protein [Sphingomonas paucimobilis]|jgi:hypothetical protein|uniref:TrbI F-type domain-containing protein n=1 Tax=Sphingomonas paucimobilis TaxID=13689 RepID=UPI002040DE7D|nr:TrbI F-type domain-containing protein [Sphingomonas paucimobilis]MCM3681014.1 type-F conjugative transfer system protein TrbI [Sphingomonas paucimobilis]